jgi:ABC-type sugar transport system substrate-binding protein
MVGMTSLPPYFESSKDSQKWEDGFKAGLQENTPELTDIADETTDATTAEKLRALLTKIDHRLK